MYSLKEIASITGSEFFGDHDHQVHFYLNDSRSLQFAGETLFIALKTDRNNGHQYIPGLIKKGVRSFLIKKGEINAAASGEVSFIVSADPLRAIQKLAAYHRQQFNIPVIGITGSNGKTVVKEWLYQLLKNKYSVCRSPKSYNSQVGVPLSVLGLRKNHQLAIFEAGISQAGEMDALAEIIRPTMGIFTSIGAAHDEGFVSRDEKVAEKFKLFAGSEKILSNGLSREEIPGPVRDRTVMISEIKGANYQLKLGSGEITIKNKEHEFHFSFPFSDTASLNNCATCAATLFEMGIAANEIKSGLKELQPLALRLEQKRGISNSVIINDFYNSDLDSMKIALQHLRQQVPRGKRVVIASDIEQSGILPAELYYELNRLFEEFQVDLVIGVGKEISAHSAVFKNDSLFFDNTDSFVGQFKSLASHFINSGILLKGARSFGFENISALLQQKSHDTVFEIDLSRLRNNINYYKSLTGPDVRMMCMVKAMGYGSGSPEVARTLENMGIQYLAVAYADEGVELRESGIELPIMVMSPEEAAFDDMIGHRLEPEIYSGRILDAFIEKLDRSGITESYPIHLKIDTGMHRLGFVEEEIADLVKRLKELPQIKVQSVFSHLAASDNAHLDTFTQKQIAVFEKVYRQIEKELGYTFLKHICNSGGISRFPNAHYDMVRLGIGMYGIGVNRSEQEKLENVGTLKTKISQLKKVKKGDTVGYNRNGKIEKDTTIAIIPIGYADGFSRLLGNGKHGVYIRDTFCRTVGNICMDMCMVDVSDITCAEGDDVIIFENVEQINKLAGALNSIMYEVLTNVSGRVKRIYVQE